MTARTPVVAVLSMLHEGVGGANSAGRLFRGRPVLAWTLERLGRARGAGAATVLCWDDQAEAVAAAGGARVLAKGVRGSVPAIDAIAAARRWSDGWRGGLLGTCEFDRGFHAPFVLEAMGDSPEVILVDPAAGLIDPALVDGIIEHASKYPDLEMIFSPAAPGLSAVLLRPPLLAQLAAAGLCPGKVLHYLPDSPCRDPLAGEACAPVAAPLARTTHRFTLDSRRQIERIGQATADLNGQLTAMPAEGLLRVLDQQAPADALPRDVVLELTTRRACTPIFSPLRHLAIERPQFTIEQARRLFGEMAGMDDIRLTLTGAGDPLLADDFAPIVEAAHAAGIAAIRVETDLLNVDEARIAALAQSAVDAVSVHLPGVTPSTYAAVMGIDALAAVVENLRLLLRRRVRATPLVVPLFVKCRENLAEMEAWYDQWLRALGAAVIVGPSDFAGQILDAGVANVAPPLRRPCARLSRRLTVLSDGKITACEQDVRGLHPVGEVGRTSLAVAWQNLSGLRASHAAGEWASNPLCGACREWHRP